MRQPAKDLHGAFFRWENLWLGERRALTRTTLQDRVQVHATDLIQCGFIQAVTHVINIGFQGGKLHQPKFIDISIYFLCFLTKKGMGSRQGADTASHRA